MKILIVSLSNRGGGASRAVHNLFTSLHAKRVNVSLVIYEGEKTLDCTTKILDNWFDVLLFRLKNKIVNFFLVFFDNPSGDIRSINIFSSNLLKIINNSDADIVHLHWIGAEMISLKQIGLINKPIVWTVHDGWIFNGIEHINPKEFYPFLNKFSESILDKYTRFRKYKHLKDKIIFFTSPSKWLIEEFKKSNFNKETSSCRLIPNIIDKKIWVNTDKNLAKKKFGLPDNKKCILFGANNADTSLNKGFVFFQYLINELPSNEYCFLVVGNKSEIKSKGNNVFSVGQVNTIDGMIEAYSASDICLIPSLSENLPYVALESILCNTPVLAFNTGGMKDVIVHMENGYLVDKFDLEDLIRGVKYLATHNFKIELSKTLESYEESKVLSQYIELYGEIIQNR